MRGNCFFMVNNLANREPLIANLINQFVFSLAKLVLSIIRMGKNIFCQLPSDCFFPIPSLCIFQVNVKHILLKRLNEKDHCKTKHLMKQSLSSSTGALSQNGMHRTKSESNVHSYFLSK